MEGRVLSAVAFVEGRVLSAVAFVEGRVLSAVAFVEGRVLSVPACSVVRANFSISTTFCSKSARPGARVDTTFCLASGSLMTHRAALRGALWVGAPQFA